MLVVNEWAANRADRSTTTSSNLFPSYPRVLAAVSTRRSNAPEGNPSIERMRTGFLLILAVNRVYAAPLNHLSCRPLGQSSNNRPIQTIHVLLSCDGHKDDTRQTVENKIEHSGFVASSFLPSNKLCP